MRTIKTTTSYKGCPQCAGRGTEDEGFFTGATKACSYCNGLGQVIIGRIVEEIYEDPN